MNESQKKLSYIGLISVVFIWGIVPFITIYFYDYYSPTILVSFCAIVSALALLLTSIKNLKLLNKEYFKIAIPTGIFYSTANILQKIGLQYTTPTKYSFLENLSCVVVPILLFFFIKKKPSFFTITSSLLCLASAFILNGMNFSKNSLSFGIGEVLCALAGIFYGVNIAATGAFAKKLYAPLYIMLQMFVEAIFSFATAIALNYITLNGAPIEPIKFSFNIWILILRIVAVLIFSTLCWVIRTNSMKHVDATVCAVMMPFSSVVTTIISIIVGRDTLTSSLVIGVILGLAAIIMSGFGDRAKKSQTGLIKTKIITLINFLFVRTTPFQMPSRIYKILPQKFCKSSTNS